MDPSKPRRKRPYAKPRIKTERIFERRALACGKTPALGLAGNAQCRVGSGGAGPHAS